MMASTMICHLKIQIRFDIHFVDYLRKYVQSVLWTLADKYAWRFFFPSEYFKYFHNITGLLLMQAVQVTFACLFYLCLL